MFRLHRKFPFVGNLGLDLQQRQRRCWRLIFLILSDPRGRQSLTNANGTGTIVVTDDGWLGGGGGGGGGGVGSGDAFVDGDDMSLEI